MQQSALVTLSAAWGSVMDTIGRGREGTGQEGEEWEVVLVVKKQALRQSLFFARLKYSPGLGLPEIGT